MPKNKVLKKLSFFEEQLAERKKELDKIYKESDTKEKEIKERTREKVVSYYSEIAKEGLNSIGIEISSNVIYKFGPKSNRWGYVYTRDGLKLDIDKTIKEKINKITPKIITMLNNIKSYKSKEEFLGAIKAELAKCAEEQKKKEEEKKLAKERLLKIRREKAKRAKTAEFKILQLMGDDDKLKRRVLAEMGKSLIEELPTKKGIRR